MFLRCNLIKHINRRTPVHFGSIQVLSYGHSAELESSKISYFTERDIENKPIGSSVEKDILTFWKGRQSENQEQKASSEGKKFGVFHTNNKPRRLIRANDRYLHVLSSLQIDFWKFINENNVRCPGSWANEGTEKKLHILAWKWKYS